MTTAIAAPLKPASAVPLRVHRFTVDEFEQLLDLGIFKSGDPVELLEGWIVDQMTHHPPHGAGIERLQDALRMLLPPGWRPREQKPIRTTESLPEPDMAIVRGPGERYDRRHPIPSDITVVIEVADTSLDEDRDRKQRIYARARIQTYWIVNLNERQVEVYTDPKAGKFPAYRQRKDYGIADAVPLVIEGREIGCIPVRDLLPR